MGASLCARSLGAPTVRAYQSVARTPQTSTSQQLWRLAGVGALAGLGLVALDGLRERYVVWELVARQPVDGCVSTRCIPLVKQRWDIRL